MKRQRRNMMLLSLSITVVVFSAFFLQYDAYHDNLDSLGQMSLENYHDQLVNVREMTMSSTELIYQEIIATPEVERIMAEALDAPESERMFYVSEMEELLWDKYQPNLATRYRSILFHLADGTTLYTLHEFEDDDGGYPEKVLVDLVHRSKSAMYGYEEGKAFGGMRYIYPVFYDGEYVGAAEFGVPSYQQSLQMKEMFSCTCTQIISGVHLENKPNEVDWSNYIESPIQAYFLEKSLADALMEEENFDIINSVGALDELEILSGVLSQKDFVVSERVQGRYFSLAFLNFGTVDGTHVGYEVFFEEHEQADYIYRAFVTNSVLILVLWILVLISLFSIQRNREVQTELSGLDHLTRIGNRSRLDEAFARESHRVERYGGVLSLIIFDIDDFKRINDQYGHLAGDKILIEVSALINRTIRATDTLVRWGGDEFIILLPGITLNQAHKVAVKIQDKVAAYVPGVKGLDMVFISVGASEYEPGENIDSLVHRADREMYKNKKGKNERLENTFV